ncbi:MAG: hypothetical protein KGH60_03930 [Candidatus Micrarchaeota archaeon]|nr:hypothetical protein [Candidatus Micrarchaeota archaeon]
MAQQSVQEKKEKTRERNFIANNRPKEEYVVKLLDKIILDGFVKMPKISDPDYRDANKALNFICDSLAEDGHKPYWFKMNTSRSHRAVFRTTDLIGEYSISVFLVVDDEKFAVYKNEVIASGLTDMFLRKNPRHTGRMRQAMSEMLHDFNMHDPRLCRHDWRLLRLEHEAAFERERT